MTDTVPDTLMITVLSSLGALMSKSHGDDGVAHGLFQMGPKNNRNTNAVDNQ